ncbi:tyrosine-protein phosphatase [Aristaeella lactis]|uniref:Protein-tyrosine phosphatase n=1 Tax=Aristaeella lactis TaxID=3046383 RepID=A0AC61PR03_9FIRM|nr:tyrosine-protein phosphatase [Aristaeella lactis]QUA52423.1 tyrosine-protein phosphatase [Aristaeella lactis]SMC94306.1 protein-tyrosine phosphatase [Aristaeella lactis]
MKAVSLLKTTRNTRDLGGHPAAGGRVTVPDRIWRSDRQENPDPEDIALLRSKGITTIIDMRTEEDNLTKPSFFRSLEGFTFLNYPIIEGDTIPESVEAVPGSYMNIACSENMPRILKAIADADTGVMYNCAAGKDRTGVVTAILLMLCGVSDEEITADYMLTKECNRERFELLRKRRPDLDMNIVIPRESFIRDFMDLFRERFGSVDGYFACIGLSEETKQKLLARLLDV